MPNPGDKQNGKVWAVVEYRTRNGKRTPVYGWVDPTTYRFPSTSVDITNTSKDINLTRQDTFVPKYDTTERGTRSEWYNKPTPKLSDIWRSDTSKPLAQQIKNLALAYTYEAPSARFSSAYPPENVPVWDNSGGRTLYDVFENYTNVMQKIHDKWHPEYFAQNRNSAFTTLVNVIPEEVWAKLGVKTTTDIGGTTYKLPEGQWDATQVENAMRLMTWGEVTEDKVSELNTLWKTSSENVITKDQFQDISAYVRPDYISKYVKGADYMFGYGTGVVTQGKMWDDYVSEINNDVDYNRSVLEQQAFEEDWTKKLKATSDYRAKTALDEASSSFLRNNFGDPNDTLNWQQPTKPASTYEGLTGKDVYDAEGKLLRGIGEGSYKDYIKSNLGKVMEGYQYDDAQMNMRKNWWDTMNSVDTGQTLSERDYWLSEVERWTKLKTAYAQQEYNKNIHSTDIYTGTYNPFDLSGSNAEAYANSADSAIKYAQDQLGKLSSTSANAPDPSRGAEFNREDPLVSYLSQYPWMKEWKSKSATQRGLYQGKLSPQAQWVM